MTGCPCFSAWPHTYTHRHHHLASVGYKEAMKLGRRHGGADLGGGVSRGMESGYDSIKKNYTFKDSSKAYDSDNFSQLDRL